MTIPARKKNGKTCTISTAVAATRRSKSRAARRNAKKEVTSEHANAGARTPNSVLPKTLVPSAMSQATIGGWSR